MNGFSLCISSPPFLNPENIRGQNQAPEPLQIVQDPPSTPALSITRGSTECLGSWHPDLDTPGGETLGIYNMDD